MSEILFALGILIAVYAWNRLIVKNFIYFLIGKQKKRNPESVEKQPFKFIAEHERGIFWTIAGFYWFIGIMMAFAILLNE